LGNPSKIPLRIPLATSATKDASFAAQLFREIRDGKIACEDVIDLFVDR